MRILAVTNLYPNPYRPGRATFNRQRFRLLAGRHDVAVIAPIPWSEELTARLRGAPPLPTGRRLALDGLAVDHPRYLYPPKLWRGSYGGCFRRSIRPTFGRALAEFRPDLIFAPWAYPDGWAAVDLGHRAGLPVVVMAHGSDVLKLDESPGRRRGTVEALRGADEVVAVSRDLAGRIVDLGADPGRVRVLYDGVDAALFHPGPAAEARARLGLEADGPAVLFVGNLLPVKGLDVLVEACALLAGDGVAFTAYLVGQGPEGARLGRRIARLGLEGRFELVGPRTHDALPDWYRAADVFALPSRSEGVPTVLLEAAACGLPFVASRVGGIPEVAHLAPSRLVPPGAPGPLAEALRHFLVERPDRPVDPPPRVRDASESALELADGFERLLARRGRRASRPGVAAEATSNRERP